MKDYEQKGGKHTLILICSEFLHKCNFDNITICNMYLVSKLPLHPCHPPAPTPALFSA